MEILLYVVIGCAVLGLFIAWFAGKFEKAVVQEGNEAGKTVAGFDVTGPYRQIGGTLNKVKKTFEEKGLQPKVAFGIYYNSPAEVSQAELKYYVGFVVDDMDKLEELKSTELRIDTIPANAMIEVQLPDRSPLSYMTGPGIAYPALHKYVAEKGYENAFPPYEIYDGHAKKVHYVFQVKK